MCSLRSMDEAAVALGTHEEKQIGVHVFVRHSFFR